VIWLPSFRLPGFLLAASPARACGFASRVFLFWKLHWSERAWHRPLYEHVFPALVCSHYSHLSKTCSGGLRASVPVETYGIYSPRSNPTASAGPLAIWKTVSQLHSASPWLSASMSSLSAHLSPEDFVYSARRSSPNTSPATDSLSATLAMSVLT